MKHGLKILLILLMGTLIGFGCNTSAPPTLPPVQLIHPELNIGEYIQIDHSKSILTFVRDASAPTRGLVRIQPMDGSMESLDQQALDGKDLKIFQSWIVYRRANQAFLLADQQAIAFADGIEKIRAIYATDDSAKVFVDRMNHQSGVITISKKGEILHQATLNRSPRTVLKMDDKIWVTSQSVDGLAISELQPETDQMTATSMIEIGDVGSYVASELVGAEIWVAYLDAEKGILKLAVKGPQDKAFKISVVDGEENKTMRGMDIQFFADGNLRGLIYLDAWALKLRMARFQNGKWESQQLPFKGSVGFYPQIIQFTKRGMVIAFHNFRSEHESLAPTFEDLAISEIPLP